jgi:molybdopterin converting factor small subunit
MPAVPATPVAPPVIRIQLFARYAELFGAQRLEVPAEGITCVRDVLERLRALPGGAAIGAATLVAVNLRQAKPDAPVSPLDEVAVLPPLAGG